MPSITPVGRSVRRRPAPLLRTLPRHAGGRRTPEGFVQSAHRQPRGQLGHGGRGCPQWPLELCPIRPLGIPGGKQGDATGRSRPVHSAPPLPAPESLGPGGTRGAARPPNPPPPSSAFTPRSGPTSAGQTAPLEAGRPDGARRSRAGLARRGCTGRAGQDGRARFRGREEAPQAQSASGGTQPEFKIFLHPLCLNLNLIGGLHLFHGLLSF